MKRNIIIYLSIFLIGMQSMNLIAQDTTDAIKKIKTWYADINKHLPEFEKVIKPLMDESSQGGELVGYYYKGSFKKILATYAGEMGKAITEYYFKDGSLFFVLNTDINYDKPMYEKDFKIASKEQQRYYFCNGSLITLIKGKDTIYSGLSEKKKSIEKEVASHLKLLDRIQHITQEYTGHGNTTRELLLTGKETTVKLSYEFYKEPDQLIVEDQSGKELFKTEMLATNGMKSTTVQLKEVTKLVFKIKSEQPNSKWWFKVEL